VAVAIFLHKILRNFANVRGSLRMRNVADCYDLRV